MIKSLFIHHIDLDGIGCYITALQYKQELHISEFLPADYKDFEEETETFPWEKLAKNDSYEQVIFADITPNEKARKIIKENNIPCLILDHHVKVFQEITDWDFSGKTYKFDISKSGTDAVLQWIKDSNITTCPILDEFVKFVGTYDLFKKDSLDWEMADSLNKLLYQTAFYGKDIIYEKYDFFINSMNWKIKNQKQFSFTSLEMSKIIQSRKKEDEVFNEFITKKRPIKTRIDNEGRYFSIIKLDTKISAIASRLLERFTKLDYLIVINEYDKEKTKLSLRSKNINLLEYEGTSGHEHACGYINVTNEIAEDLWLGKKFCLEITNKTTKEGMQ